MPTSRRRVAAVLVVTQLCFATLSVVGKIVLREMSGQGLVLVRVAVAAIVFYALHRLTTNERIRSRGDYARLALYSVLGVSLNQLLFLVGLRSTTATAAQILLLAGPAITLFAGILLGRERSTVLKWLGIALASAGALLLIGVMPPGGRVGNLLVLANVTCYAIYLVLARDIARSYKPLTVITWIFVFGAIALLPVGLAPAMRELPDLSVQAKLGVVWIIVFPTLVAYYLNVWALGKAESSFVSTFLYLQPLITAFLAYSILGERLTVLMLPAAVLIFGGVAITIREQRAGHVAPSPAERTVIEA
jgi:drug/metabolite transporter (DMT)-like permease